MKFYALVLWRLHGRLPAMLQLVYLGSGEVLRYAPDEADLLATERKIKALWTAIVRAAETGDWRPSPSRLCEWCDHHARCPTRGGTPPPLPEDAVGRVVGVEASQPVTPGLDEDA
jgi:putative RecB family exonuclease